jgi:hypothetical protein
MPVIDTEQSLRKTDDPARRIRSDQGTPLAAGGTLTATNVQDAINQLAALTGGGGGGGAHVTISDTPPPSPTAGDLWWNSAEGQLYIYYNDGNSTQWVAITTSESVGSGGGGVGVGTGSFTTSVSGAGNTVVPAGKNNMIGEAWGAGGSAAGYANSGSASGGGGGYSRFATAVTPGQTIYWNVGAAAGSAINDGVTGGTSWINPSANSQPISNGCVASGGGGGAGSGGGGGVGTIGSTNYSGGIGVNGQGAGGGGGAGSSGNGSPGNAITAGLAGLGGAGGPPDGGNGGNGNWVSGGPGSLTGFAGAVPGGGGGSGQTLIASGGGAGNGRVRLTFS